MGDEAQMKNLKYMQLLPFFPVSHCFVSILYYINALVVCYATEISIFPEYCIPTLCIQNSLLSGQIVFLVTSAMLLLISECLTEFSIISGLLTRKQFSPWILRFAYTAPSLNQNSEFIQGWNCVSFFSALFEVSWKVRHRHCIPKPQFILLINDSWNSQIPCGFQKLYSWVGKMDKPESRAFQSSFYCHLKNLKMTDHGRSTLGVIDLFEYISCKFIK